MNITRVPINVRHFLLLALLAVPCTGMAAEFSGRFSMLGATAQASQGDFGYLSGNNILSADQQSLRLMLDETGNSAEWSIHVKTVRQHLTDIPFNDRHSSDLFRLSKQSAYWISETEINNSTHVGYELDRAVYKKSYRQFSLALGRQPVDWGSGRFWQPLNVFGAFAPTDLDTDYKPGIDSLKLDWFPSAFSSLSAVYAFAPTNNPEIKHENSGAVRYKRQAGEQSELSLLAGNIVGNTVLGASFESSWSGMGWRLEGLHTQLAISNENFIFWIAGLDYQFNNGTLLTAEWYDNSRGATQMSSLANLQTDPLVVYGLQPYLGRNVLGLSLGKDLTPLLRGDYVLLISPLKEASNQLNSSVLQQINLTYSVSNESDLLFSLQFANGRGLDSALKPQSEFGHLPASLSVRLRFYF